MVDHQIHDGTPMSLVAINGHVPGSTVNATAGTATVWCETCGWTGRSYRGRWADKADEQWRVHAGDIAMRIGLRHGEPGNSCHCRECRGGP